MKYLIILIFIIFLAWCPWLSKEQAMKIVDDKVVKMQEDNPDLCPMLVNEETISKTLFGYTEKVSYDCNAVDAVYGVEGGSDVVFITFYSGLIGMPQKVVKRAQ
jgi:hypothetical protein